MAVKHIAVSSKPSPAPLHGGRIRSSGFTPHRLFTNPHLQTLVPALAGLLLPPLQRRRLELPDGDFVDIAVSPADPQRARTALLVHGLGGLGWAPYLNSIARTLFARGWNIVALELRGAGREPNRLPRSYHHGDTGDLRYLCRLLHEEKPDDPIVAVGWSLGGGVLLKALGEDGDRAIVQAAVAVSAPYQIRDCVEHMSSGASALYQRVMLAQVKRSTRRKHARVPAPDSIDLVAALRARDFMTFGDVYTARINGYAGIEEYCSRNSCAGYLASISRPTLIIHALDDPITPASSLPAGSTLPAHVTVELSARGGHVGFVESGRWGLPALWLNRRIPAFLEAAVDKVREQDKRAGSAPRPVVRIQ